MPHTRGTVRLRVSGYKAAPACQRLHVSSELQEALQEAQEEALPEELQEAQSEALALRRLPAVTAAALDAAHSVGQPSPSCLVVRPFVVALPTVWSFACAGAASCAYSYSAHVRPCAQGRCGRCPPGSGVMSDF